MYKYEDIFVIAKFEEGYNPVLNIRYRSFLKIIIEVTLSICSIMPWKTTDLSPSIWHKLYLDTLKTKHSASHYTSSADTVLRDSFVFCLVLIIVLHTCSQLGKLHI